MPSSNDCVEPDTDIVVDDVVDVDVDLIVVLGAPNDPDGTLGLTARLRADQAVTEHRRHPDAALALTGGFGAHFNTSSRPHHEHVADALVARGVPRTAIVAGLPSMNTVEDARFACDFARAHGYRTLCVVTSQFHAERARLLFTRVQGDPPRRGVAGIRC
jgi:uncharacterized SAM-binding protein YcdF (DUF218 family)